MLPKQLICAFLAFGLGMATQAQSEVKTLKLDGHGDKPKSNAVQFVEQVLESAYKPLGYSLTYQPLPLARSFVEANQGRLDGLRARVSSSAERYSNLYAVPFALFDFEVLLLGNREHCGYCDLQQLNTVATIRGFKALDDYFSQLAYQPAIVRLTGVTQVLDMLQKGRVDAVILPSNGLPEQYWRDINRWSKYPLISLPDFHFLHKQHQPLIPLLLEQFQKMQQSGELQALRSKYGMQAPVTELAANSLPVVNVYISTQYRGLASKYELQQLRAIFASVASQVQFHSQQPPAVLSGTDVLLGVDYMPVSSYRFSDMHLAWVEREHMQPLFAAFASDEMGHNLKVLFEKQYRLLKRQQSHTE